MVDLSKFKVPPGSLVVDTALVVALIWGAAKMTAQLEAINTRVDVIDAEHIRQNSAARILVLERRADEMNEWKGEVRGTLNRIEDKLDRIYESTNGRSEK